MAAAKLQLLSEYVSAGRTARGPALFPAVFSPSVGLLIRSRPAESSNENSLPDWSHLLKVVFVLMFFPLIDVSTLDFAYQGDWRQCIISYRKRLCFSSLVGPYYISNGFS